MRLGLLALLPLCACTPQNEPKEAVLRLANWGGAGSDAEYDRLVIQLYRDFEKENPGVKIKVENNPENYVAKMVLGFVAKAEPDIMMLDASSASLFINNGVLADLTPLIEKDPEFKLDDFFPNVVDIARRGDALYAIPQDFTPMVMYYNKRVFDAAGVPYPKAGWTFDDFLQTAKKLTTPTQYGFALQNWMPGWIMWIWNKGGDVVSPDGKRSSGYLDGPKSVEAVQFLADLVTKHKVAPSLSQMASMGVDPFANAQAAMTVSGHWAMIGYANAPKDKNGKPKITWDDLGVVELPHNTPHPQTVMYESGFAIGRNCKQKDLAWKFVKYMTSHAVQSKYNSSGIAVCGRKDVAMERAKVPLEAQFLPIIPSARAPYGSWIEGYAYVEPTGQGALDSIIQGRMSAQEALTKAAQKIDREFSKN